MTEPLFPGLTLDDAEREIHAHVFGRHPEADHNAKLRRVAMALSLLSDPHDALRAIHVTGTNGKTSTSRMAQALLQAHGLKTGLFTSPHLHSLRERIQVDGAPISQHELVRLWHKVAPVIHRVDAYSLRIGGPRMSFFEVLTVLGMVAFADARVDVAVVEVGIGGLRDATNVIDAELAVLTPMGLDHTAYFGDSVAAVAHEKTGIIKPHATVVTSTQPEEAAEVITRVARTMRASLLWEGAHSSVESVREHADGQTVTLRTAADTYPDVELPLHGAFQAQNALQALGAVEAFLGRGVPRALDLHAVRRGFAAVTSPGRLERVATEPLVYVDAAHNPHGVAALVGSLATVATGRTVIALVAVLGDKDARGILEALAPHVDAFVVTQTTSPRALDVGALSALAADVCPSKRIDVAASVGEALATARSRATDAGLVLATGSITLVAQVREAIGAGVSAVHATLTT